ncbi:MAG TPA: aminoglycoside 6-adenylyltransferase, partial [Gemmatimonadales bacterium]|nr:aminoglycoside 6-adenylyltransferase [Gemmatimonadales bacterium]
VLLDKDDLCVGLPAPSGQAFLVRKPSERDFLDLVNEFWWETTYVARNLARGELLFAKYNLDYVMKLQVLRRLLEWRVSADHGWDYRAGLLGRGLHPRLEPDLWAELEGTFGGGDLAENWASLWRTCVLFRRLAQEMAVRLGVNYPLELDDRVTGFLKRIENEQS